MKLNRKIIIPAATLLIGFAMAGSATSTIAWYQYSTKANVAFLGTSAGTSGNLQLRLRDADETKPYAGWKTFLSYSEVSNYLGNKEIAPITTGAIENNVALPGFYANPIAGYGKLNLWKQADSKNYVVLPLQFKFVERDGSVDNEQKAIETLIVKDIYLSDLLIKNDYQNAKADLSDAIRVHFNAYASNAGADEHSYYLASKEGGNTTTVGTLDLDGDSKPDKSYTEADKEAMYGFGANPDTKGTEIMYGEVDGIDNENQLQKAISSENILNQKLGSTSDNENVYLNVDVTIWIEGWHRLPISDTNANPSATWDIFRYAAATFDVGMQFEAKDHQVEQNPQNP